jgi:hypothetical protein
MRCKPAPYTNGMTAKLDAGEFVFICNGGNWAVRLELTAAIANSLQARRGWTLFNQRSSA